MNMKMTQAYRFFATLRMTAGVLRMTILGALLVLSCAKTQEKDVPVDDGWTELDGAVPVSFAAKMAEEEVTKTTSPLPTSTNFRVFGFYQRGVVDPDPAVDYTGTWDDLSIYHWTPNFMYNEAVTYDNVKSKWTYSPVKYWPNNAENTLTFWAYSPYYDSGLVLREADGAIDDLYGATISGLPDIQFTTDASKDLLISELAQDLSYRSSHNSTVSLTFHHAMCWVDFTVTKVDPENKYDMYLKSISIEDLYFTAVFSPGPDLSGIRWLNHSGTTGDISVFSTNVDPGVELSHSTARNYPPLDGGGIPERQILPMPQRLVSTATNTPVIHVVYSFKLKDDTGDPATYESYYPLGNLHPRWEKEQHYTYNVHISPGVPLLFTASVERWDNEQNGYFNVNE